MTLGKYNHLPLLHVDRRGGHDKMYPFFLFDRSMKVQIHAYSQQRLWARALSHKVILFRRAKKMHITSMVFI